MTTSVDIGEIKDKGYYYCYRRVIKDYDVHVEEVAHANVVENECAYCHDIIVGPATYYVPGTGEVSIAGAMVTISNVVRLLFHIAIGSELLCKITLKSIPCSTFVRRILGHSFLKLPEP